MTNKPRQSGNPAKRNPRGPVNGNGNGSNPGYPPPQPALPQDVLNRLQANLDTLTEQNRQGMQKLQMRSIGFDPIQLTNARIDALITSIAEVFGTQGPLWELQCRITFEQHVAENIERAQLEGTKAQLAQASSMSPAGIRQLARQTGTFGG